MARTFLQPGFRFHPTDVELVMYYLRRKVTGKSMHFEAIRELDLYKFAPWDLPDKSCMQTGDLEWYFYCARDKKYANGIRANRATDIGYWKTTGRDRPVNYDSRTVGMKKTLVFHIGRAPRGDRTNWVMHEYRLQDTMLVNAGIPQDSYVLCKVFEKSGAGPKNGEQYGAPFREEDWEDNPQSNLETVTVTDPESTVVPPVDAQNSVMKNIGFIIGDVTGSSCEPIIPCQNCSEKLPLTFEDGDTESSLAGLKEDVHHLIGNDNNEKPEISNIASTIEIPTAEDVDDIFNGLEDLNSTGELKKADRMNLPNLGSKYALSQMLLGGDGSYMELLDLECPINLPVKACAYEHLQCDDIDTDGSEPKIVNKFKFSNCLDNKSYMDEALLEEDRSYVELGDLRSSVTVPEKFSDSCPIVSSNLKLKGADEFHFSVSPGDNFLMDQLFENDRSFVELNDLVNPVMCPVEANHSKQVASEDLHDCFHDVSDVEVQSNKSFLWDASLPFHEGCKSIGGTCVSAYENYVQNPGVLFAREAGEETFISEDRDRGEQQIAYSSSQRLLDSIPAHPASAAEHPPINGVGKGSKGGSLFGYYAGSSIHVKAEVTVRCRCTEDALSGKLGELSCLCYHRGRCITGDTMKEAATLGGEFTFVLILGMFTALFWVCVFAVAAKLGQYTWKLIIT